MLKNKQAKRNKVDKQFRFFILAIENVEI